MPWSDLQPPADYWTEVRSSQSQDFTLITGVSVVAYYNALDGVHQLVTEETTDAGDIDVADGVEAIRQFLSTGALSTAYGLATAGNFGYEYQSFKSNDPVTGQASRASIEAREVIASFDSTPAGEALPAIPDPLYDIPAPWEANPGTGAYVQYEEPAGIFVGWAGQSGGGVWQPDLYGFVGGSEPMTAHFMACDYIDTPWGSPPERFYQAGDGTTLADWSFDPTDTELVTAEVSLDGVDQPRFSMVVIPGQLAGQPFGFADYPMPALGAGANTTAENLAYVTQCQHGRSEPPIYVLYRTPPWRYWTAGPTEVPYLRMTQRDDGMGIRGHARLDVASDTANQATSVQHARTPRVGQPNTYV